MNLLIRNLNVLKVRRFAIVASNTINHIIILLVLRINILRNLLSWQLCELIGLIKRGEILNILLLTNLNKHIVGHDVLILIHYHVLSLDRIDFFLLVLRHLLRFILNIKELYIVYQFGR